MRRPELLFTIVAAGLGAWPATTHASTPLSCVESAEKAQSLRRDRHLLEAARLFAGCAAPQCPTFVKADCARWLEEVTTEIPTIIVRLVDKSTDVLSAMVLVDGNPATLGAPIRLDPGPRKISATTEGRTATTTILLAENEKNRLVVLRLPESSAMTTARNAASSSSPAPSPWPWIAAGVGVVGLATFGGFYASAQAKADELEGCKPRCNPREVDSVGSRLTISGIGLAVGVVGFTTAIILWATGFPRAPQRAALDGATFRF